jgi:orotate phosphoribosyltransferase
MPTPKFRDAVMGETFVRGDFTFASGTKANNKLQMERLKNNPELFDDVIRRLGVLAMVFNPDLISYVPDGARLFAEPLAADLGLPVAHLWKAIDINNGQPRNITYKRPMDHRSVRAANRLVIIEDVTTKFTSTKKVLDLPDMRQIAIGQVSIVHRGWPAAQQNFELKALSLIGEYMPEIMEDEMLASYERLAG